MNALRITVVGLLIGFTATPLWANTVGETSPEETPTSILTLQDVLARVEQAHPLLQGSQTQKIVAAGKLLKAMGAFEPNFVNDWELERLVKDGSTKSVGFNDTFVEMRHPLKPQVDGEYGIKNPLNRHSEQSEESIFISLKYKILTTVTLFLCSHCSRYTQDDVYQTKCNFYDLFSSGALIKPRFFIKL